MDPQLMDGHPPLSVLVVDDHPDSADILALLVKTWGHDARSATSGDEALALAAEFRPQVALLDLAMPGLNGFEVARRMRQTAGAARPLLIAVSGYGRPQEHSQADEAGFDYYLLKPYNPRYLEQILNAWKASLPLPEPDAHRPGPVSSR